MSGLSPSTRKAMLGIPLKPDYKDHTVVVADAIQPSFATPTAALPQTHDWRNYHGKNYVSPILDQGRCGSCVAFATIGTFETQLNITATDATSAWELSPQYLFSCGGGSCDEGWEVDPAAQFLVDTGVVDNSCMPYASGPLGDDVSCSKACSSASKREVKAKSYTTPTSGSQSVTAVKNALVKGPLIATMTVYADFEYYSSGVYKHVTGDAEGGHAVSIIGWSDKDEAWIARNQWGTDWGMGGFFEIAWSDTDSGVGQDTWALSVTPPGHYVTFAGVHDHDVLSGTQALTVDASSGLSSITWSLTQNGKAVATGSSADGKTATLDTTKVADGVYNLEGHGTSGTTVVGGEIHPVYILNGKESGAIGFATLTSGQQITGEASFNISVSASPVPLTQVTWAVTNAAGATMLTHETIDTGATMQLYWDTTRFPNGSYTVTVTGPRVRRTLRPLR